MIMDSVAHLPNVTLASLRQPGRGPGPPARRRRDRQGPAGGLRRRGRAAAGPDEQEVAGIETLFIPCSSEYSFIASKYVRDFARFGGADRIGSTVPEPVLVKLKEKFGMIRGLAQPAGGRDGSRADEPP